jgi:hypothetical protein
MSKTTQENPAVENSAQENVSNTSKATSTTRKAANTTSKAASTTLKQLVLVLPVVVRKALLLLHLQKQHQLKQPNLLFNRIKP